MRAIKLTILSLAVAFSSIGVALAQDSDASDFNAVVPEPGTMILLLTGLGIGAAYLRRRK